ncbi:MAG: DUF1192 domain-containing protein [Parvularculaceae bacterium]
MKGWTSLGFRWQDLYTMSVGDLGERTRRWKAEIVRCEKAMKDRGLSRDAAEKLFKF